MPRSFPYQPILLRVLHGTAAVLAILALISGFWVYNTYDQRWGSLTLPSLTDIQGIHGTLALLFLLVLPAFAFYSFHLGYRRLIQEHSLGHLKQQLGKPIWWVSVHHFTNTLMLMAVTFAVVTGRMMKEEWLPAGEIDRPWYLAHLVAWVFVLLSLALHLLLGIKVGQFPLILSMFSWRIQPSDTPQSWLQGLKLKHSLILQVIEVIVIGCIFIAFILPLFSFN